MNHIKTYLITLVLLLVIMAGNALAQDIPAKPNPPRLVNDYTSTLTQQQVSLLENMLVAFNDTTSNQIVIVMVNTFKGNDKAEFADRIGEEWGGSSSSGGFGGFGGGSFGGGGAGGSW